MRTSDVIVRCLENEGVRHVFGVPGEEILDILDSLAGSSIQFIPTRHEQGAAFMADAYGRLTGRAGVCLSTLGPGATNLATGVADANLDHAPLVAITGQAGRDRVHKESHQYVDIVEAFRPLTKWNTRVETPRVVPEVVRKAFKVAESEKPGACHLEVPEDVAEEASEGEPLSTERARRPSPDRTALRAAARLIEGASFPLIFAGNGVIRGRASKELRALARAHGIPVVNTFMAKGAMPYDDPLSLLSAGLQSRDYVACGFERADLIIAVGYDLVEYAPKFWNPERKKTIVHVDFVPAEVDGYYQPAVEVVADVREALELLNDLVKGQKDPAPYRELRRHVLAELQEGVDDDSFPLKPQRVLRDLRRAMARDDVLISDVGSHKVWIARTFPAYEPNSVLISNGFRGHGHRGARRGGGQARAPGAPGGLGQWRRRISHERAGAGDREPAGSRDHQRDLPRRGLQPHPVEAADAQRSRDRGRVRQPRLRRARPCVRRQGLPSRIGPGPGPDAGPRPLLAGREHRGRAGRLP